MIVPAIGMALRNSGRMRRVGAECLHLAPWEAHLGVPIVRGGARTLATWLAGPLVLTGVAVAFGATDPRLVAVLIGINTVGALAALLGPASGIRDRIRLEKRAELERIECSLAGEPDAMQSSCLGSEAAGFDRLRLLEWRRELDALREWPFDAPVLRRFALLVALPLLSWIAGALVERGLDALLDRP